MKPTRVLNGRALDPSELESGAYVYIGRPSKWGNPFHLPPRADVLTRVRVIAEYGEWLLAQPEILAALPEVRGKNLWCWCTPQLCHGDLIALAADRGIDALRERVAQYKAMIMKGAARC